MMMPFVRLLAIYALVGAAIFAFLKRDEIIDHYAAKASENASEEVAPAPPATAPKPATAQTTMQPAATPARGPNPNRRQPAAFGSEITPQYFGQSAAPASAANPAPAATTNSGTLVARWIQAREAYSQGNATEAANLYEALAADFPENADLHGEVGNLYYNLGQFSQAATHYLRVGEIAVDRGDPAMASMMYGLLQRISPSNANTLLALINSGR